MNGVRVPVITVNGVGVPGFTVNDVGVPAFIMKGVGVPAITVNGVIVHCFSVGKIHGRHPLPVTQLPYLRDSGVRCWIFSIRCICCFNYGDQSLRCIPTYVANSII